MIGGVTGPQNIFAQDWTGNTPVGSWGRGQHAWPRDPRYIITRMRLVGAGTPVPSGARLRF